MNEASNKRLGTIRNVHEERIKQNELYSARFLDVEWLIEQAERAQELEKDKERLQALNGNNLAAMYSFYDENKRLREALSKIKDEEEQNLEGYETVIYKMARQALEGGELHDTHKT